MQNETTDLRDSFRKDARRCTLLAAGNAALFCMSATFLVAGGTNSFSPKGALLAAAAATSAVYLVDQFVRARQFKQMANDLDRANKTETPRASHQPSGPAASP